ncbi:hypothetical protein HTY52_01050 [Cupriavidus taiwanensis]|uniref:hypothetical protein n=1 Tax=Cupriavidus taiwanensis TaxID=164546 RepID=UPI00157350A1|nr:hypothetical protein [Cupriavidus taiwanensis]NSX12670.1 hypothetical protein [Cupriavidus taiwanensis]
MIATLRCRRDVLAMLFRCCVDANRCVHASLSRVLGDGVARRLTTMLSSAERNAVRACRGECVKHAARAPVFALRACRRTPPRGWKRAARALVHRPQSLYPCGFSESAMTRGGAFHRRRAHAAKLVIGACDGV